MQNDLSNRHLNENEQRVAFDQYKMLVESLNKLNEMRENSNSFWMGTNAIATSTLAYLRDNRHISPDHKSFLLGTLIILGIFLCYSWLSYLWRIKEAIELRSDLLIDLEKLFPIPLFSKIFAHSPDHSTRATLTIKEMLVPSLFIAGYLFFGFLLLFFTKEVIAIPTTP